MRSQSPVDAEVAAAEAARLIGRTTRRLRQLVEAGFVKRAPSGRYVVLDVVLGHQRCLEQEAARASASAGSERVRAARAREIEIRVAEREGQLIDVRDAEAVIDEIVGIYRSGFGSLPARVAKDLSLRRKIEAEIDGIQAQVAEALAEREAATRPEAQAADAS